MEYQWTQADDVQMSEFCADLEAEQRFIQERKKALEWVAANQTRVTEQITVWEAPVTRKHSRQMRTLVWLLLTLSSWAAVALVVWAVIWIGEAIL